MTEDQNQSFLPPDVPPQSFTDYHRAMALGVDSAGGAAVPFQLDGKKRKPTAADKLAKPLVNGTMGLAGGRPKEPRTVKREIDAAAAEGKPQPVQKPQAAQKPQRPAR